MTHPEGSLAGYVDGTLPLRERAVVDAHLTRCSRCRDEVTLAGAAHTALSALPEIPAPQGISSRALQEAGAERAVRTADGTPRWYRFAGIAAAAAAALLVLTLALPRIGQSPSSGSGQKRNSAESGSLVSGAEAATAARIEIQHTNYDSTSLTALATSYSAVDAGAQATASTVPSASGSERQTSRALRCVVRSASDDSGQLIRLIRARFEGTPAYFAVFLEGPGAEQPADGVSIWVFSAEDCSILSYSSARL
jgi:hypothetical protein